MSRSGRRRISRRIGWGMGAVLLLMAGSAIALFRPDRGAAVGAGVTAHNLCSAVFVAGLDPDEIFRELVTPLVGRVTAHAIHYQVGRAERSVTASFAGIGQAHARYTPGYGCRLDYPETAAAPSPEPAFAAPPADDFAPPEVVAPADAALAAAIERVFTENPTEPAKRVKALVVAKDGRVVAEHYAPGYGIETPLLSYSVAKSFTNAILGVLVLQGRLAVDQPLDAPEWAGAGDPRGRLSIEDLLRMQSGLDAAESSSGFDPVSRMLFAQNDMAGFAAQHPLKQAPGSGWEYTSANTMIIDRLLGRTIGGGATGMRAFAERELFAPLHMSGVTMEFDGTGVFVGASYLYAPARSYARFGELYMNDGVAPDGRRILPEGWVAWSRRSTLGEPYGAGFWTNDGPSRLAALRVKYGFPKDGFFASGNLGQRIYIVPSAHLVVARFGYSEPPDFGIEDDLALIASAITTEHDAE